MQYEIVDATTGRRVMGLEKERLAGLFAARQSMDGSFLVSVWPKNGAIRRGTPEDFIADYRKQ